MYTHTDRDQIDELKKLWHSWGKWVLLAVIIGCLVGVGWRYWQQRTSNIEMASASQFELYANASLDSDRKNELKLLQTKYSATPYAAIASLQQAKTFIAKQKWSDAILQLEWAAKKSSMPAFKQIARLQLAAIAYQQKKYQHGLDILNVLADDSYLALVNQRRAELYVALGKTAKAHAALKAAMAWYKENGLPAPLLQRQLASLQQGDKTAPRSIKTGEK